jgi:hypothetical protein
MKKSISKKLQASRKKTSLIWRHYRVEKKKIVSKKRLPLDLKKGEVSNLLFNTRKKEIPNVWKDYRDWKFGFIYHSPYENFKYVTEHEKFTARTVLYKSTEKYFDDFDRIEENMDNQIKQILNESGVVGVMLIFKVKGINSENDTNKIIHISDFITKSRLQALNSNGLSAYQNLTNKLIYAKYADEFDMKKILIRIYYETS